MHQKSRNLWKENQAANDRGGDACQEDSPRGDVQTIPNSSLSDFVQAPINGLHRAVKKLGRQHKTNATQEQAPFQWLATKNNRRHDYHCGNEEMHEETGMTADAQFHSPECLAEFVPPMTVSRMDEG